MSKFNLPIANSKSSKPLLIVTSAPSGAGKTTLCDKLLKEFPEIVYSVSCTTRKPRGAEKDGVDYIFLSTEAFSKRIDAGDFLEYAVVHDNMYGTLKKTVSDAMEKGHSVIMDIDVVGAAQVRDIVSSLPDGNVMKDGFIDIFINAPSQDILRQRLEKRGEDAQHVIEKRLENAKKEIAESGKFMRLLINSDISEAYEKFKAIIIDAMKWR